MIKSSCQAGMRPSWIMSDDERRRRERPKKDKSKISTTTKEHTNLDYNLVKLEIDIENGIDIEPCTGEKDEEQAIAVRDGLSQKQSLTLRKFAQLAILIFNFYYPRETKINIIIKKFCKSYFLIAFE